MSERSSKPVLFCAFGLLAAFFMPWVQLFGVGVSGYNLANLGSYGNYAWIIPILAGGTVLLTFSGVDNRPIGAVTGIVPLGAVAYVWILLLSNNSGSDRAEGALVDVAQHAVSIGVYLTIILSVAIIIAASRNSSIAGANDLPGSSRSEIGDRAFGGMDSERRAAKNAADGVLGLTDREVAAEREVERLVDARGGAVPLWPSQSTVADAPAGQSPVDRAGGGGRRLDRVAPLAKVGTESASRSGGHQFCGECGSRQEPDARFCDDCGSAL